MIQKQTVFTKILGGTFIHEIGCLFIPDMVSTPWEKAKPTRKNVLCSFKTPAMTYVEMFANQFDLHLNSLDQIALSPSCLVIRCAKCQLTFLTRLMLDFSDIILRLNLKFTSFTSYDTLWQATPSL